MTRLPSTVRQAQSQALQPSFPATAIYLPLMAWIAFSLLTIYCYYGGPFIFPSTGSTSLAVYLIGVHIAIIAGYGVGVRRYRVPPRLADRVDLNKGIRRLAYVALAGVALALVSNAGSGLTLEAALTDPGAVREAWIGANGTTSIYLITILAAANYPLVSGTAVYWKQLTPRWRWPAVIVVMAIILYSVQGGSRAGIFGIMAVVGVGVLPGVLARHSRARLLVMAGISAAAIVAFAAYSSFITTHRSSTEDYGAFLRVQRDLPVDLNHYSFDLLPKMIEPAVLSGYFYFGHSYEGLAMCIDKPFIGTGFGMGHSSVLIRNLVKITGNDNLILSSCIDRLRIEDGYSSSLWVTTYAWIANDLTYTGSVLFLGVLGWMLATSWLDVLNRAGLAAAAVLGWLAFGISATSVAFPPGDVGSVLGYWGSIALWLLGRRALRKAAPPLRPSVT